LLLVLYGVEVWKPTGRALTNALMPRVDGLMSISQITLDRCLEWSGLKDAPQCIIPNAIDLSRFGPGPKSAALLDRYKLRGKRVLLTLARLSAEERYKGVDEMLARLPHLRARWPDLAYLIVGDGTDKARLEQVARGHGVSGHVVFAGRIPEHEKLDHYRLGDVFVMPGRGEGFGFVFLEALASGIPVVASRLDGSREAVRNGLLGALVDPNVPMDIDRGVAEALARPRGEVPDGLSYFSYPNFEARVQAWVDSFPALPGWGRR
jgi:glycosyltransferase involved in cell wall biosynthesis